MHRTRIKICGLTRSEDVQFAVSRGADAIGFVFARSPRQVSVEEAARLAAGVPAGVLRVGLFLDQEQAEIERVLARVPLDVLQFHGRETGAQCSVFALPWLKAVAMEDEYSLERAEGNYAGAMGLLLDSHQAGQRGGSGRVFDWSLVRSAAKPLWLAGGLNAANVAEAIKTVQPYAVDVSSGVESAPGVKDSGKISEFIEAARAADKLIAGSEINE
ncbi:MAG: phosphoribosylanthranilate isomerase [Xanthomonadales bacterium]|nr:phosphoribosylanthranilate isomerase [Xanthomonadales bacterium]